MYTLALPCPTLIGRTDDLATLHLLVARAGKGQGGVALVSGEAGIGKSRLVAEVKTEALAHDFWLVQGSCFPTDHAIPYAPLLDLLRSFLTSRVLALPAAEIEPMSQAFLPLVPDLGHVLAGESPSPTKPSLDPEQEKRRRFEVLAHFLTTLAGKHPVLLVVEDLHWSDDTSLEFLHYLARRSATHPLLLLLTYRSEEMRQGLRHFLAQLDREHLAQEILLARLTRDEVEAMLQAVFALPRSLRLELPDPLYGHTEGNPFFIEEVLKSLIAAGEIFYVNGRWERKELRELHIPRSVQDAVQQRTDRLSAPARQVLTLAAVAGRRFDFALLQALTHHDEQHLLQLVKELIAAQLVVEESAEQFAFRHALTRQAIYGDLLVRERKALHHRIAETMERLYSAMLETHLADLAYHFYEAGAWEKALLYTQRAGVQAQAMYAPGAAIEQVTRALDAAERGLLTPPASLYRLRGQAYETLGDFERAHADYQTTLQMAREASDRHAEWQSLYDLGFLWTGRNYAQAGTYFQQALALARQMDDPLTLAHSLNRMGNWHLNVEQPLEALHYHQEALAIFQEVQDRPAIAETFDLLGMTNYLGGDLIQGQWSCEQALAIFRELDDRPGLVSSLPTLMLCSGNYFTETIVPGTKSLAETLHLGELALKTAREIGQRPAEAYTLLALAVCLGSRGEYARALELAQRALEIAQEIEHRQWMSAIHWGLGRLYLDLLAVPAAHRHLEQALALAHELGSEFWIHATSGLLASASLLQHDIAQAEAVLTAALGPDAPAQTLGQRQVWYARAELSLATGKTGRALDITDELIASAKNVSAERTIPLLLKLRGEALSALKRPTPAETALRTAQQSATAQGARSMQWRIAVALGKLYRAELRDEEAAHAFAAAQQTIEQLAPLLPDPSLSDQFLQQAAALIPGVRQFSPRQVTRRAFGGLTERECEVAVQITQGKSNREIAEQLTVTERTVEAHVRNILTKLELTSRTQIAVWAITRGLINNVQ